MAAETDFWILLCVTMSTAYALDVVGCGGFIKSSVPLNFSKIQVIVNRTTSLPTLLSVGDFVRSIDHSILT